MVEDITEEMGLENGVKAYSVVDNMEFYTVHHGEGGYTIIEPVKEELRHKIIRLVKEYQDIYHTIENLNDERGA